MLRLEWTTPAADEFERNQTFYEDANRHAARVLAARVYAAIGQLRAMPHTGRPGLHPGTREWVVQRTPYVLVYQISGDVLQILHIWHGRQDWTGAAN